MWLVIILIILVVIIALARKNGTSGSDSAQDSALLFSYFEKVRNQYYGGERNCSIIVGSPIVEIDGTSVLSGHLTVYVSEEDNSGSFRAQALGMQTKFRDGKYEHHLIIRKKFSKQAKQQILQDVGIKIQQTYSNDFISYDPKLPMLMVLTDLKNFVEATQRRQ